MTNGNEDSVTKPKDCSAQLNDWLKCFCVVTFDLEFGQVIEGVFPNKIVLPESEKSAIAYLSFPDSNSGCLRDTSYHFRIRSSDSSGLTDEQCQFADSVPDVVRPSGDFLFGFVHFRQQKNPELPRGYYQKSVVILTRFPLFGLFAHIVDAVALGYFESGDAIIEAACSQIEQWVPPTAGIQHSLPLLGRLIHCRIPSITDVPSRPLTVESNGPANFLNSVTISNIHETNLYESTKTILSHLQILWELILTGEPLVVMTPNPSLSANVVQSLTMLISPLRYSSDYRPFFTIHDAEFAQITTTIPKPSIILGVTNPFFAKALNHWPHFLRIGDSTSGHLVAADRIFRRAPAAKALDSKPGLYTEYKPFLSPDKNLTKKLLKVGNRPDAVQNSILRRHFLELTQSFMIPLERYISSLMPLKKQISPFKSVPQMRSFELNDFLSSLSQTGPILTCGVKGDWSGLYRRFVGSPNFESWLQTRLCDIDRRIRSTHLDVLCSAELSASTLSNCSHVEVVDLVLKLRDQLTAADSPQKSQLQSQLNAIMAAVDSDLQQILLSNGELRNVFGSSCT